MYNPRKIPDEHLNLFFPRTLTSWDEAIPLGNGLCGALIWGTSKGLRFSLDRGDLWDTTPYDGIFDEEFSYPAMVRLAREKNADEIRRVFDAPYNQPLPSKLPAGKLIFDFRWDANICSGLNLRNAEAAVTVGGTIRLRSFLHAGQKVGMIRLNRPLSAFSFRVERPPYGTGEKAEGDCGDTGDWAAPCKVPDKEGEGIASELFRRRLNFSGSEPGESRGQTGRKAEGFMKFSAGEAEGF